MFHQRITKISLSFLLFPFYLPFYFVLTIPPGSLEPRPHPFSVFPRSRVSGLPTCTDSQTALILRVLAEVNSWSSWAARTTRNRRWDGQKEADGEPYLPPDYPFDVFSTSFGQIDTKQSQSVRFFVERRFGAIQSEVRKSGVGKSFKSMGLVSIECDDVGVRCKDAFAPYYGDPESNFIVLCPLFFTRAYPFQPREPLEASKTAILLLALMNMKFAQRKRLPMLDIDSKDPFLNPGSYVKFASLVFVERQKLLKLPYKDPVTGLGPPKAPKVSLGSIVEVDEEREQEE